MTKTISKSPENKLLTISSKKGVNIIPLAKLINKEAENNSLSARSNLNKLPTINNSPRNVIGSKVTANLKNNIRTQLEIKAGYKSPSPNRLLGTIGVKILKKSPNKK